MLRSIQINLRLALVVACTGVVGFVACLLFYFFHGILTDASQDEIERLARENLRVDQAQIQKVLVDRLRNIGTLLDFDALLLDDFSPIYAVCQKIFARGQYLELRVVLPDGKELCSLSRGIQPEHDGINPRLINASMPLADALGDEERGVTMGQMIATRRVADASLLWRSHSRGLWQLTLLAAGIGVLIAVLLSRAITQRLNSISNLLASGDLLAMAGLRPGARIKEISQLESGVLRMAREARVGQRLRDENVRLGAVARTTEMLAHDIRRPFSMLKAVLTLLRHAETPERLRAIVSEAEPELQRAIKKVNAMLTDIMEVGSSGGINQEAMAVEDLLLVSLKEVFSYAKNADIRFTYELKAEQLLNVDVSRMSRVLENILVNAAQAMQWHGEIWFATRQIKVSGQMMTELTIGNSGPAIDEKDVNLVFEAFFSKGKRGGTGLGLAIAKKIVSEHGGTIRCQPLPGRGTEFVMSLPVLAALRGQSELHLPKASGELLELLPKLSHKGSGLSSPLDEQDLLASLGAFAARRGRLWTMLVVDDDSVFFGTIRADIAVNAEHAARIELLSASDFVGAKEAAERPGLDLALVDIDLGSSDFDGYTVINHLRQMHPDVFICVHSNRFAARAVKDGLGVGADMYLPKPVARGQLLSLIKSLLSEASGGAPESGHRAG